MRRRLITALAAAATATVSLVALTGFWLSDRIEVDVRPFVDSEVQIDDDDVTAFGRSGALSGVTIGPVNIDAERAIVHFLLTDTDKLSIRVDRKGHEPSWRTPSKDNAILIKRDEETTITVYGEEGYRLEMIALGVSECEEPYPMACLVRGDIKKPLQEDGIRFSQDQESLVLDVLNWASNTIDFSAVPFIAKQANREFPRLNASQILTRYYEPNRLAGFCGATAVFTAKVLREIGIDAFTINFGLPGGALTHVSVVWRTEDGAFHFVDPTFNGTFFTGDKMTDILRGDLSAAEYRDRPIARRTFIFPTDKNGNPLWIDEDGKARSFELNADVYRACDSGRGIIMSCQRNDYSIESYFESFLPHLEPHGLTSGPQAFVYLFKKGIFSVGNGLKPGTRDEFMRAAAEVGIPIHGSADDELADEG